MTFNFIFISLSDEQQKHTEQNIKSFICNFLDKAIQTDFDDSHLTVKKQLESFSYCSGLGTLTVAKLLKVLKNLIVSESYTESEVIEILSETLCEAYAFPDEIYGRNFVRNVIEKKLNEKKFLIEATLNEIVSPIETTEDEDEAIKRKEEKKRKIDSAIFDFSGNFSKIIKEIFSCIQKRKRSIIKDKYPLSCTSPKAIDDLVNKLTANKSYIWNDIVIAFLDFLFEENNKETEYSFQYALSENGVVIFLEDILSSFILGNVTEVDFDWRNLGKLLHGSDFSEIFLTNDKKNLLFQAIRKYATLFFERYATTGKINNCFPIISTIEGLTNLQKKILLKLEKLLKRTLQKSLSNIICKFHTENNLSEGKKTGFFSTLEIVRIMPIIAYVVNKQEPGEQIVTTEQINKKAEQRKIELEKLINQIRRQYVLNN